MFCDNLGWDRVGGGREIQGVEDTHIPMDDSCRWNQYNILNNYPPIFKKIIEKIMKSDILRLPKIMSSFIFLNCLPTPSYLLFFCPSFFFFVLPFFFHHKSKSKFFFLLCWHRIGDNEKIRGHDFNWFLLFFSF